MTKQHQWPGKVRSTDLGAEIPREIVHRGPIHFGYRIRVGRNGPERDRRVKRFDKIANVFRAAAEIGHHDQRSKVAALA